MRIAKTLKFMTEEEKIMEEEIEMSITTPILLPEEIHIEILSWIPAKSLISSFKLVCKSWRNLIKDPDFIKMHLNRGFIHGGRSSRSSSNESLIRKPISGNAIFQLYPPFNLDIEGGLVLNPRAEKMDIDSSLLELKSRLVGSCNGLLCLSVTTRNNERIVLLNPSTKKYRESPKQLFELLDWIVPESVTYGFGCYYNSTNAIDEYKVVRMAYFYPYGHADDEDNHSYLVPLRNEDDEDTHYFEFQIDIYSMSSNSWRRWRKDKEEEDDVVPYEISLRQSGVFLNGAFHWMGCKLPSGYVWDTIVSFNIKDEEFGREVPVPPPCEIVIGLDDEYPYIKNDIVLMNVRGYLGNVCFSRTEMMDIDLEIWVMKEYGIKESWTKEFVIRSSDSDPPSELFGSFISFRKSMTCFFTGDQILIEGRVLFAREWAELRKGKGKGYGRLVLYDMNKKKINGDFRMVDIPCVAQDDQVDYIETLVSLESSVFPLSNNRKRKDMESLRNQNFNTAMIFEQRSPSMWSVKS